MLSHLVNRTLIVTTILSSPYCMLKVPPGQSAANVTVNPAAGNEQFEGYGIDVVRELAGILGFRYMFKLVPDGHHGTLNHKTGKWDGLILELLEKRADLAIADLTITLDRIGAVDFSIPFMDLGISLLHVKPGKQPPDMFSFVSPLAPSVWAAVAAAYLSVALLLCLLARFTPVELIGTGSGEPHTVLERQPSLFNCFWFAMGPLTQQGSELLPSALSTRMVACMWWFFALIIISSYTANLAAFLTVEKIDSPIKSVEDLARQTKIKYGVYSGGSSATFFREATTTTYLQMWLSMESARPSVFTVSNSEGVERVVREKGGYAFLMESASIQYVTERRCELAQVGGQLDRKGYGIAMPKNSTYLADINRAMLRLHETGILHVLKTRWWKQKRGGGLCATEGSSTATELGLANVGGVFLVYMSGVVLAVVAWLVEKCVRRRSARRAVVRLRLEQGAAAVTVMRRVQARAAANRRRNRIRHEESTISVLPYIE